MKKRGSHIGFILSFVLFVTFLFFVYLTLQPSLEKDEGKNAILEHLMEECLQNVSGEINLTTIKITKRINHDCLDIRKFMDYIGGGGIIAKDSSGKILGYEIDGDTLTLENPSRDDFFKIYNSNSISSNPGSFHGCDTFQIRDCDFGVVKSQELIFEDNIDELKNVYDLDYEDVKTYFNVPDVNDFGFEFTKQGGGSVETEVTGAQTNIYAKEVSVKYVSSDGNILTGKFKVLVW